MHFAVTILGNNSAIPAHGRHPTAQVVTLGGRLFLVDCGEGTQLQMSRYKIRKNKITHVFISHLHGDHYFGLIGLLNSFGLQNRTAPLHIYGPQPLEQILKLQFDCAHTILPYPLYFHPLTTGQNGILLKDKGMEISTFPTNHRIDCFGFLFKEKHQKRKIAPEKAAQYGIPFPFYKNLQNGADYQDKEGRWVKNEWVTSRPPKERSYAFCADTLYDEGLIKAVSHCDLIYHETTYLHNELDRARKHYHTTAQQAATLAKKARAKCLLIGHYSSKYTDLEPFINETQAIFKNTLVSREGVTYIIDR